MKVVKVTWVCDGRTESREVQLDLLFDVFVGVRASTVSSLKLSGTVLNHEDLAYVMPVISGSLAGLDLSDLGMTSRCVKVLAKRLTRTRLIEFNISGNLIGDESSWMLLNFINGTPALKSIGFARCGMTAQGIWPLMIAIGKREFDLVDISGNLICAHGAEYIKQFLSLSPVCREFRADDAGLSEGDVELILSVVGKCDKIEVLSLKGNQQVAWRPVPSFVSVDMNPRMG
jgi:Ran GTPase-activating protein (RanGAP) involved in mRNA processing and transport